MNFMERLNDLDYFIKNYELKEENCVLFKEENYSKSNFIELVYTYYKPIVVEKIKDYKFFNETKDLYVLGFDSGYNINKNKKNNNIIFGKKLFDFFTITSNKSLLIHDDNFSIFEKYEDLFNEDIWFYLKLKEIIL